MQRTFSEADVTTRFSADVRVERDGRDIAMVTYGKDRSRGLPVLFSAKWSPDGGAVVDLVLEAFAGGIVKCRCLKVTPADTREITAKELCAIPLQKIMAAAKRKCLLRVEIDGEVVRAEPYYTPDRMIASFTVSPANEETMQIRQRKPLRGRPIPDDWLELVAELWDGTEADGQCARDTHKIAELTDVDERTARRWVDRAEELGFIEKGRKR